MPQFTSHQIYLQLGWTPKDVYGARTWLQKAVSATVCGPEGIVVSGRWIYYESDRRLYKRCRAEPNDTTGLGGTVPEVPNNLAWWEYFFSIPRLEEHPGWTDRPKWTFLSINRGSYEASWELVSASLTPMNSRTVKMMRFASVSIAQPHETAVIRQYTDYLSVNVYGKMERCLQVWRITFLL